ncbi:MAG TPA: hypothetical protein VIM74_07675 [Casimicrobiaceae bacterium]
MSAGDIELGAEIKRGKSQGVDIPCTWGAVADVVLQVSRNVTKKIRVIERACFERLKQLSRLYRPRVVDRTSGQQRRSDE